MLLCRLCLFHLIKVRFRSCYILLWSRSVILFHPVLCITWKSATFAWLPSRPDSNTQEKHFLSQQNQWSSSQFFPTSRKVLWISEFLGIMMIFYFGSNNLINNFFSVKLEDGISKSDFFFGFCGWSWVKKRKWSNIFPLVG